MRLPQQKYYKIRPISTVEYYLTDLTIFSFCQPLVEFARKMKAIEGMQP